MSMIYFGVSLPCFKLSCQVFKEASILGLTYFSCSVTVLIIRQTFTLQLNKTLKRS